MHDALVELNSEPDASLVDHRTAGAAARASGSVRRCALACGFDLARPRGLDEIHGAEEIHLADIDAVVAENRIGDGKVKIQVWNGDLPEVVPATDHLIGH